MNRFKQNSDRPLMLWCSSHLALGEEEIPLYLDAGFRVVPLLTDMWTFTRDPSLDRQICGAWKSSSGLSTNVIERLQSMRFYENFGKRELSSDEIAFLNEYVDVIYVTVLPNVAIKLTKAFQGSVVFRPFGSGGLHTYSQIAEHLGEKLDELNDLSNYVWCPILTTLLEPEDPRLCRNPVHVGAFVTPGRLGDGRWRGAESENLVIDTIPRIVAAYYRDIYERYVGDYGEFPLKILGGNERQGGKIGDPRITGRLPDGEYQRTILSARLSIYHGTTPYHLHYHPLEYITLGVPTIFHRDSGLAAEARAGGFDDERLRSLGMYDTPEDARIFARAALADWRVAAALGEKQGVLLEELFDRRKALQQARWLRTVCADQVSKVRERTVSTPRAHPSDELPPEWQTELGRFRAADGALRPSSAALSIATLRELELANVAVSARVELTSAKHCYGGLLARYRGPGDTHAYLAMLGRNHPHVTVDLWKHDGKGWSRLFSKAVTATQGSLALRVDGDTLKLLFDGDVLHCAEDASLPEPGAVGIRGYGSRIRHFQYERLPDDKPSPPLRIGVWCDFGKTLTPTEGIGVFVHNLAAGFLEQPEPVELSFVVHPGEASVMDALKARAPERVRVIEATWRMQPHRWLNGILRRAVRLLDKAKAFGPLALPLAPVDGAVRGLWSRSDSLLPGSYPELIRDAGCDVWLIPYVGFEYPIEFPAVIFIHDLVIYHYPEMFEAGFVEHLKEIVQRRAKEATICACMSDFIRQKDLYGVLGLPPEKVRMVPVAPPRDLPTEAPAVKSERPYLFYPAAFRGYKNHRLLIESLRELEDDFDVVFTGPNTDGLPADLDELARKLGVRERVRVTGCLDRAQLGGYLRGAFAIVVPSLYEQASFPVYEALAAGVPVACADIPPLREQCRSLGEAMLYFDPKSPASLARVVKTIAADREEYRARQQELAPALWKWTWKDAATEWLPVFRKAAGKPPQRASRRVSSPREDDRRRVLLFLPSHYLGGVWQVAKNLVGALREINEERKELELSVGVAPEQMPQARRELGDGVALCPVDFVTSDGDEEECVFGWGDEEALAADAWLALADRFEKPLRRERPLGVFVFDDIERPAGAKAADRLFVTNAHAKVEGAPERVRLVPVACDPAARFEKLAGERVPLPRKRFLLNVANASPHKGLERLLRAQRILKKDLGEKSPLLVVCGHNTEVFSARSRAEDTNGYWKRMRACVRRWELEENEDVLFLGHVGDGALKDLLMRASTVVNAALDDNGSFSLIEAHYFGKPVISTDYPASRTLYERFGLPVDFVPPDDEHALAAAVRRALAAPKTKSRELARRRERLAAPELGYRRFAETIYDELIQLAHVNRPATLGASRNETNFH